nr:unnamed protein product [Digitaria exilis]
MRWGRRCVGKGRRELTWRKNIAPDIREKPRHVLVV